MATGALGAALTCTLFKEVMSHQSHNCNDSFWSQPPQVTGKCVLGVGCVHLAQAPKSGAVSEPAEILFFFASFSCRYRDDSEANPEDLSQKFLVFCHPSAFSHYFSSNKRHGGASKEVNDIFQSNYRFWSRSRPALQYNWYDKEAIGISGRRSISLWIPDMVPDHQPFRRAWPRHWAAPQGKMLLLHPATLTACSPSLPYQPSLLVIPSDAASLACRISIQADVWVSGWWWVTAPCEQASGGEARNAVSLVIPLPIFSRRRALSLLPFTVWAAVILSAVPGKRLELLLTRSVLGSCRAAALWLPKVACPPHTQHDASTAPSPCVPASTNFCKAVGTGLFSDLPLLNHQHMGHPLPRNTYMYIFKSF